MNFATNLYFSLLIGIFVNCLQFQISTEEIPPFFGPPLLPNEDFLEKIVGVVTSGSEMLINYKKRSAVMSVVTRVEFINKISVKIELKLKYTSSSLTAWVAGVGELLLICDEFIIITVIFLGCLPNVCNLSDAKIFYKNSRKTA